MTRRLRKGDLVKVLKGADRGKQGRITAVDPKGGRVRVERVKLQKHHLKPGRRAARTGGIVELEGFIDASNVMLVDSESGNPSRVRIQREEGRRTRVFAKSGKPVPDATGA